MVLIVFLVVKILLIIVIVWFFLIKFVWICKILLLYFRLYFLEIIFFGNFFGFLIIIKGFLSIAVVGVLNKKFLVLGLIIILIFLVILVMFVIV